MTTRDARQKDIIPTQTLQDSTLTVIGVGAIGRQAALMGAAMGYGTITLIDPDTVDTVNLATQGFPASHVGMTKVNSVSKSCSENNPEIRIVTKEGRFSKLHVPKVFGTSHNVVMLCVDSITDRKFIWEALKDSPATLIVDGRMTAEACEVIACAPGDPYYETTLFEQADAYQGSCTAKSTIYCASIAAGQMHAASRKHLTGMTPFKDRIYNILADEYTVKEY